MKRDRYEVLRTVVRIANSAFGRPRGLRGILRYLSRVLDLEEAVFFLWDARQRQFLHQITTDGPPFPDRCPEGFALSDLTRVAQCFRPHLDGPLGLFPVYRGRRSFGVLSIRKLDSQPLSAEEQNLFEAVCDELSCFAQNHSLQRDLTRKVDQLTVLSELGRVLNQAGTLPDLLEAAVEVVLEHCGATCVVLRPLYGDTVLGPRCVRIDPQCRFLRPLLLGIEEEVSSRALGVRGPWYGKSRTLSEGLPSAFPPDLVSLPLLFQERAVGTLTLFGGGAGNLHHLSRREIRELFSAIGSQIAHALERVATLERLTLVSAENDRKLRETELLSRMSRAMHGTLRLNELMHLMLSAATLPGGGGFERAMLFTINERTGIIQGMLGVSQVNASLVLPEEGGGVLWDSPQVTPEVLAAQRQEAFCRQVLRQRLSLEPGNNALARAARSGQAVTVLHPGADPGSATEMVRELGLGPYACVPLMGKEGLLGVLLVDNPQSRDPIVRESLRFLELFAAQAGSAMENSLLLLRLEATHKDLRETQERLIQGEKLAALGEMAASIAHELRNPLVPIGGFAQRIHRTAAADSKEQEYSSIIVREVRRMEKLLTEILAFSRKQLLCFSPCRLEDLAERALVLQKDALEAAKVHLDRVYAPGLPDIQGDEQKLLQVALNLVDNARQVMAGGGTLTLRTSLASLRGEPAVTLQIEDTGGGIPEEALRDVFAPFYTTKERGTGLGLSISQRIVEQHGGNIEVRNTGQGVIFTLCLPVSLKPPSRYR